MKKDPAHARPARPARIGVAAAVALAATLAACGVLESAPKPGARVAGTRLEALKLDSADLAFDVEVSNPYDLPLPVARLDYALATGGTRFLSGETQQATTVPAKGKAMVPLTARVGFAQVLSAVSGIRPGVVLPYTAEIGVSVDAPVVGPLRLPVTLRGDLPIPNIPQVAVKGIRWTSLGLGGAEAVLDLEVKNTNDFPIDAAGFAYNLALAGTPIVTSTTDHGVSLDAGGTKSIPINFRVTPASLGPAVLDVLRGSTASFRLNGTLQAMTPFGRLDFPVGDSGQTTLTR